MSLTKRTKMKSNTFATELAIQTGLVQDNLVIGDLFQANHQIELLFSYWEGGVDGAKALGLDLTMAFKEFHGDLLEFESAFADLAGVKSVSSMKEDVEVLHHWMRTLRSAAVRVGATCPDCGGDFDCRHDSEFEE